MLLLHTCQTSMKSAWSTRALLAIRPCWGGNESLEPSGATGSGCGVAGWVLVRARGASAEVTLNSVTWLLTAEEEPHVL